MSDRPLAARERIVRRLDPKAWEVELCPELADILRALIEASGARVVALGYANIKAPELIVALDRQPAPPEIAAVWGARAHPDLILTDDGIGCGRHYCEVDWTATAMAQPRLWSRVLRAAMSSLRLG